MASFIGTGGSNPGDVKTGGKVGIGTTSDPSVTLDVRDGATELMKCFYEDTDPVIQVGSSATNAKLYRSSLFIGGGSSPSSTTAINFVSTSEGRIVYDNTNNKLGFYTGGTQRVTIDGSGNVGIGSTLPSKKLDVSGEVIIRDDLTLSKQLFLIKQGTSDGSDDGSITICGGGGTDADRGGSIIISGNDGPISGAFGNVVLQAGTGFAGQTYDGAIQLYTSAIGIHISKTAYVGIGCTDPQAKFDVNDNCIRIRSSKTPTHSTGTSGDKAGMIAWDTNYLYVCKQDYDGTSNIWRRITLPTGTW